MANETDQTETGWQAQLLRLTTFLSAPLDPGVAATLWKTAVGNDPETDDNRPRESMRQQAGPYGSALLAVTVTPGRIDWVMTPQLTSNASVPVHFASLEPAMRIFLESGQQWLSIGAPIIHRIAVGAVLLNPTPDLSTSYHKLKGLLRAVQVVPDRSSDFLYQINWPLKSGIVSGLKLNRLTRWNALTVRLVNFQVHESMFQQIPSDGAHYCRLECDHNTATDNTDPFSVTDLPKLFQELCDLVVENAQNGEVMA